MTAQVLSIRAHKFMQANAQSPVVYASVEGNGWKFRLADNRSFVLGADECRQVGVPRLALLVELA